MHRPQLVFTATKGVGNYFKRHRNSTTWHQWEGTKVSQGEGGKEWGIRPRKGMYYAASAPQIFCPPSGPDPIAWVYVDLCQNVGPSRPSLVSRRLTSMEGTVVPLPKWDLCYFLVPLHKDRFGLQVSKLLNVKDSQMSDLIICSELLGVFTSRKMPKNV